MTAFEKLTADPLRQLLDLVLAAEIRHLDWPRQTGRLLDLWSTANLQNLSMALPVIQQELAQILENRRNESCRAASEPILFASE